MTRSAVNPELVIAAAEALPQDDLTAARREAAQKFAAAGFPTTRNEDWKYTSLADAADISNAWLQDHAPVPKPTDGGPAKHILDELMDAVDAYWLVLRNGIVHHETSRLPAAGVTISGLSAADVSGQAADHPLAMFNTALLRDGLRIRVADNREPDKPIGIVMIDDPSSAVTQTRVVIEVGAHASLSLFECELSSGEGRQFTNSVTTAALADGAQLKLVRLQNRSSEHTGVAYFHARLNDNAQFHCDSFDFGGALSRNEVIADVLGKGANAELNGLYLATGRQHIDNHTCIRHAVGPATSIEEYRGILSGRARCVFNGKVIVEEGADGTDSSQTNHNLLLSERAEIDTKPELEIYADDVKCAHGATVGQLDKAALFYLRSRGLDEQQARQVLTRAFAEGALGRLSLATANDFLARILEERLDLLTGDKE